jgi:serine/threonine-protein kinase RsbW
MTRHRFQIIAAQSELRRAMGLVEAFCGVNKLPAATCNLMNLALDEVLSNIAKYGYPHPEHGIIDVELSYANNTLTALVEDRGIAFNPFDLPIEVPSGPLNKRRQGGLGIVFVKSLLDSAAYERIGDRNKVTLTIKVPGA